MKKPVQIYFLCYENRCRSQIAEAFAKHYGGEDVIVQSAGLEPTDIHPFTIEAMKEVGIEVINQSSKKINMKYFMNSSIIVKLCQKAKERCPVIPFNISNVDWDIDDPLVKGDMESVRKARDEIQQKIIELLHGMNIPVHVQV